MQSSLDLPNEPSRVKEQKCEEEQQLEALLFGYKYEKVYQEVADPSKADELFYVDTSRREDISEEALKALRDPSLQLPIRTTSQPGRMRKTVKKTRFKFIQHDFPKEPTFTVDLTQNQISQFQREIMQRS